MTTSTVQEPAASEPPPPAEPFGLPSPKGPHPLTQRRIWLPLAIVLFILNIPFLHYWTRGDAKTTATIPFQDNFERTDLGDNYFATGGFWRILNGWLYSPGVKNNPLWIRAPLPHDVRVEFDARAESTSGDIKCEIFGNGRDHSSGYVMVFGGWTNTISTLARLDEHGTDRKTRTDKKVEKSRVYHWKVERKGNKLDWYIDNELFLSWDDPQPLAGSGHDRLGFGTWTTDAYFDNIVVTPL